MEVETFSPPQFVQARQSKILIIGPVGAGKSSFFNTIASVFRGYVSTDQAASGSAEQSITSQVITCSRKFTIWPPYIALAKDKLEHHNQKWGFLRGFE